MPSARSRYESDPTGGHSDSNLDHNPPACHHPHHEIAHSSQSHGRVPGKPEKQFLINNMAGQPEYQKVKAELKAAMMKITQKKLDLSKKEFIE